MRIRHQSRSTGLKTRFAGRRGVSIPLHIVELTHELNPVIRGWGEYYKRAHVRRLFNQLDCWVVRRVVVSIIIDVGAVRGGNSTRDGVFVASWGLISLVSLIPSLRPRPKVKPS